MTCLQSLFLACSPCSPTIFLACLVVLSIYCIQTSLCYVSKKFVGWNRISDLEPSNPLREVAGITIFWLINTWHPPSCCLSNLTPAYKQLCEGGGCCAVLFSTLGVGCCTPLSIIINESMIIIKAFSRKINRWVYPRMLIPRSNKQKLFTCLQFVIRSTRVGDGKGTPTISAEKLQL